MNRNGFITVFYAADYEGHETYDGYQMRLQIDHITAYSEFHHGAAKSRQTEILLLGREERLFVAETVAEIDNLIAHARSQ